MPETKQDEKIRLSSRVRFRAVENEGVMVHLKNGRVLVVNEVGLFIVQALSRQAMMISELADAVAREFDVDAPQAGSDVVAFLDQLRAEQAVDMVDVVGPAD